MWNRDRSLGSGPPGDGALRLAARRRPRIGSAAAAGHPQIQRRARRLPPPCSGGGKRRACVVALGNDVAGLMTNNQPWADQVKSAADSCSEPLWQLPMFPEYGEQIRSEVADIKNVGDGRWGGAITAAKFLEEFVANKPWV